MQIRQAPHGTRGTDHSNRITRVPCFTENYTPYLPCSSRLRPFILPPFPVPSPPSLTVEFVSRAFDKRLPVLASVHTAELLTID